MAEGATVEAVFTSRPSRFTDEPCTWTSSILRERMEGPAAISLGGLAGDKVAQPYHGGPSAAICVHLANHYASENERSRPGVQAGATGQA